jgi:hypothetical protein
LIDFGVVNGAVCEPNVKGKTERVPKVWVNEEEGKGLVDNEPSVFSPV